MELIIFLLLSIVILTEEKSLKLRNTEVNENIINMKYGYVSDITNLRTKGVTSFASLLWTNRNQAGNIIVPYNIETGFNDLGISVINSAIEDFLVYVDIRLIARTNEDDFISFSVGNGCSSFVGRQGGGQSIVLEAGCWTKGIVIHEIMHALGFWHEQSRPDRDDFVFIDHSNILPGFERNFDIVHSISSGNSPYDYNSVMHYGSYDFALNASIPVVTTIGGSEIVANRVGFSESDISQIKSLYGTQLLSTTTTATTTSQIPAETTTQFETTFSNCRSIHYQHSVKSFIFIYLLFLVSHFQ